MENRVRGFEVIRSYLNEVKRALKKVHPTEDEFVISIQEWVPQRGTSKSAGYDIKSLTDVIINPGTWELIPTGLTAYMLDDEELQIRPRSGLALKKGISVLNTPGTIDSDYYGKHIGVILMNNSSEPFKVTAGDKIAQAVFSKYLITDNDNPVNSDRTGGFGSTGI